MSTSKMHVVQGSSTLTLYLFFTHMYLYSKLVRGLPLTSAICPLPLKKILLRMKNVRVMFITSFRHSYRLITWNVTWLPLLIASCFNYMYVDLEITTRPYQLYTLSAVICIIIKLGSWSESILSCTYFTK